MRRRPRIILPIIIVIIVIAAIIAGIFFLRTMFSQSQTTGIDTSKYQAVFFTNGQVYFGKLQVINNDYMKLTDIWYLQTQSNSNSTNPQSTTSDQSNTPTLVKLGNEIHGPEDQMIIAKGQVLFYENLKPDGTVVKSITKAKQK